MNKFDRIFIGILTVIICISWIYAVKNFSKGREAINVIGEGKVELPPNQINMNLNAIFEGENTDSQEQFNKELKELEKTFAELNFKIISKEKRFVAKNPKDMPYQPTCYMDNKVINAPCLDAYISISASGDKVIENGQKIIDLLVEKSNRNVSHTQLSVHNADEAVKQARLLALQDAKQMAKRIAKELGVKLGRLLQSTEYAHIEDEYHGNPQENYVFIQNFHGNQNIEEAQSITIIRKAYLTYDID